ncbi:recombinase family protein [Streptomyces sp. NPDC056930]|uniref:recombinase family protein n=1 Tax=Streptomyces sp. NPDC056930 TaxID=3345967 RepID=UPI00362F81F9
MRVAIYARISRVTEATTSIARQIQHCEELCRQRGWTVAEVYADEGVSGTIDPDDRPRMGAMLQDLSQYNAIVFYKIDRLARSTVAFADLMKRCQKAKVSLTSVTEPMDLSSPIGRAMAEIIAVFARLERDMIRERSLDARRTLLSEGKFVGGRFPFGITTAAHPSGKGRVLVRDKEAIPIIKSMANKVVNEGYSATQVAKWLNDHKVLTSRQRGATAKKTKAADTYWRGNAVRVLLRNPQLIGHQALPDGRVRFGEDGMPLQVFPPAMTLTEWNALQAALDRMDGKKRTTRHDSHWLQPFLRCDVCNHAMTNTVTHGRVAFKCARPNEQRHKPAPYIRLDELEPWVLTELQTKFGSMAITENVWVGGSNHTAERNQVEATIQRLRDDRGLGLYDGEEDEAQFRSQMKALIARRGVLASLPDEPGHWEAVDTGRTVADDIREGSAASVLESAGFVIRVAPSGGGRNVPVGTRATIRIEDPVAAELEAAEREEAAWEALEGAGA